MVKHPDREVKPPELVFATFLPAVRHQGRAVPQRMRLPRRDYHGDIIWRTPTISTVATILKNPAYAGAFVYGRTRAAPKAPAPQQRDPHRLPEPEWRVVIRDKYPAYIDWATFEKVQAMIRDNHSEYEKNKTRGVPRAGKALLHGLVSCGECGHKMLVQYKGKTRYICNFLRKYQSPVCHPADPSTMLPSRRSSRASPVELDVYERAQTATDWERINPPLSSNGALRYRASGRTAYQKSTPTIGS